MYKNVTIQKQIQKLQKDLNEINDISNTFKIKPKLNEISDTPFVFL